MGGYERKCEAVRLRQASQTRSSQEGRQEQG